MDLSRSITWVRRCIPVLVWLSSASLSAQGHIRDFVLTGGMAAEVYRGGIPSVTLPIVDSTDAVSAVSGEFGFRSILDSNPTDANGITLVVDGGVRQFTTSGFQLRDYAPRVWTGVTSVGLQRLLGLGALQVGGRVRARKVEDRTPIPLFLQPGYADYEGSVQFLTRELRNIRWDLRLHGGRADYQGQDPVPQLDLLDRNEVGTELGASWRRPWSDGSVAMRVHSALTAYRYPRQGTSYAPDPFRRDHTYQVGAELTYDRSQSAGFRARVGIEGTLNRSNASRPEYNAMSLSGSMEASLPTDMRLHVFASLTAKNYLTETEFTRLIPGEEADNVSQVYAEVVRPLNNAFNAALRVVWTRQETDIADAYYERYGITALVRYRP